MTFYDIQYTVGVRVFICRHAKSGPSVGRSRTGLEYNNVTGLKQHAETLLLSGSSLVDSLANSAGRADTQAGLKLTDWEVGSPKPCQMPMPASSTSWNQKKKKKGVSWAYPAFCAPPTSMDDACHRADTVGDSSSHGHGSATSGCLRRHRFSKHHVAAIRGWGAWDALGCTEFFFWLRYENKMRMGLHFYPCLRRPGILNRPLKPSRSDLDAPHSGHTGTDPTPGPGALCSATFCFSGQNGATSQIFTGTLLSFLFNVYHIYNHSNTT